MSRRRRTGRVAVPFEVIERFATLALPARVHAAGGADWQLMRSSSLHRRKDGTYTLVLIWRAGPDRLTSTYRGLRLEAS